MATLQRADRRNEWWVDFRWRGRRIRKRAPLQSKRGAVAFEQQLRTEFVDDEAHGVDPFAGPRPTLAEFSTRWMNEYVAAYNRPSSAREKRSYLANHLLPAFGHFRLDEIDTRSIDRFVVATRERVSPKTLNNILATLRRCLRVAVEWRLLRQAPLIRGVRVVQRPIAFLKEDELTAIIAAAPTERWRVFFVVVADTGMRFGEAAALRWLDVDLGQCPSVHISRGAARGVIGPTKTGSTRTVPLTRRAAAALLTLRIGEGLIFPQDNGGVLRPEWTLNILHRACARAKVTRIGWHGLRHTYATRLCQRGVPLRNVQALLGHTTIIMTSRYAHEGDLAAWVSHALDTPVGHLMVTKPPLQYQDSPPALRVGAQSSKIPA